MTIAMLLIFATCITAGVGVTFHSGLAMRAEERFFAGWIIGIVVVTICGVLATRLFTFNGPAIAIACVLALAISATGWRAGADQISVDLADLRRRLTSPVFSGENPMLLVALLIPVWILIARMFGFAYQSNGDGALLVGHLASFSDWQAHLTYTASFAYADNTALNLPLATGNNIGYHAGINYFAAMLIPAGSTLPGALQVSGAFTVFAFPGVMYSVGMRVFGKQSVALLGTVLFLFFGGWGVLEFFKDFADNGMDTLRDLPRTYTRLPQTPAEVDQTWWNRNPIMMENPIVGHFFPQRPTMIGFPLVILVLGWMYTAWNDIEDDGASARAQGMRALLFCGVLVGLTPFFNLFAFGVPCAFVGLWWIGTRFRTEWLYFLVPAAVLAFPVVIFLQPPSSSLEWPYNWVGQIRTSGGSSRADDIASHVGHFIGFWLRNLGFFLPLLVAAQAVRGVLPKRVAIGLLPIWLFFIVPNAIKPHPWNGNNTHYFVFVLLLGALPVAALLIEAVRRYKGAIPAVVALALTLTLGGFIDVMATNDQSTSPYPVTMMDSGGVAVGEWARTTDPDSVFVIELGWAAGMPSPHQHPVPALSGRDLLVGNAGWVNDLGIPDWGPRTDYSRTILEAGDGYAELIDIYDVDYLVIGPNFSPDWAPNIAFWEEAADVVYRHAGWTVYEV